MCFSTRFIKKIYTIPKGSRIFVEKILDVTIRSDFTLKITSPYYSETVWYEGYYKDINSLMALDSIKLETQKYRSKVFVDKGYHSYTKPYILIDYTTQLDYIVDILSRDDEIKISLPFIAYIPQGSKYVISIEDDEMVSSDLVVTKYIQITGIQKGSAKNIAANMLVKWYIGIDEFIDNIRKEVDGNRNLSGSE